MLRLFRRCGRTPGRERRDIVVGSVDGSADDRAADGGRTLKRNVGKQAPTRFDALKLAERGESVAGEVDATGLPRLADRVVIERREDHVAAEVAHRRPLDVAESRGEFQRVS